MITANQIKKILNSRTAPVFQQVEYLMRPIRFDNDTRIICFRFLKDFCTADDICLEIAINLANLWPKGYSWDITAKLMKSLSVSKDDMREFLATKNIASKLSAVKSMVARELACLIFYVLSEDYFRCKSSRAADILKIMTETGFMSEKTQANLIDVYDAHTAEISLCMMEYLDTAMENWLKRVDGITSDNPFSRKYYPLVLPTNRREDDEKATIKIKSVLSSISDAFNENYSAAAFIAFAFGCTFHKVHLGATILSTMTTLHSKFVFEWLHASNADTNPSYYPPSEESDIYPMIRDTAFDNEFNYIVWTKNGKYSSFSSIDSIISRFAGVAIKGTTVLDGIDEFKRQLQEILPLTHQQIERLAIIGTALRNSADMTAPDFGRFSLDEIVDPQNESTHDEHIGDANAVAEVAQLLEEKLVQENQRIKELETEAKRHRHKVASYEKEHKILQQKLKKASEHISQQDELLSAYLSKAEQSEDSADAESASCDFPYSTDLNIVLYGGRKSFHAELAKLIPGIRLIPPTTGTAIDTSPIRNADIVFIQIDFLNHSAYYSISDTAKKCGVPRHCLTLSGAKSCAKDIVKIIEKLKAEQISA